MPTSEEVREKADALRGSLLDQIETVTTGKTDGIVALRLAEAYAWLTSPAQPHGGSNAQRPG